MIDAGAVIAQLRATEGRSGGRREAWREPWAAERERLDELARATVPEVVIERDAFANAWYVLGGESEETVLVHSHSDCVPGGGWLDGILGVHAGLGVLAALACEPRRPRTVAVVDWADEEGTRFGRSLVGSSAATGALSAEELGDLTADDGAAARDVVSGYGFDPGALGTPSPRLARVVAAAELHIEQGSALEREGRSVAAVSGCLGVRRSRIAFAGTAGHAGALAMADRRDPVRAAATFIAAICRRAEDAGGLATVGRVQAEPMIATAVAARCELTLDLRHRELGPLEALGARARVLADASRCPATVVDLYRQDPVRFDPNLVQAAAAAASHSGDPLMSGPLHDSAALAQADIPAVMLFVPSIGGISHARAEDTAEDDLAAGIDTLHKLVSTLTDTG
ncbi:MAG TPA: hydantoinase/carbamoylase family amidase [Solirubrobacteraceae bacterium]|nr:hydantoinase/carbamoylase family amidase [Solirubrobacteraceae bacterium]